MFYAQDIIARVLEKDLREEEARFKEAKAAEERNRALQRAPGQLGTQQLLEKIYGSPVDTPQLPQTATNPKMEPTPNGTFPKPPGLK